MSINTYFRVKITGALQCMSNLHIGGDERVLETERLTHTVSLNDYLHEVPNIKEGLKYNGFIRNSAQKLYVPASTLRGSLRRGTSVADDLFGILDVGSKQQQGGKVRIYDGKITVPSDIKPLGLWHPTDKTGLHTGITINSQLGVIANEAELYHHEVLGVGTEISFDAEMDNVNDEDIKNLIEALKWWNGDISHNMAARKSKSWGVLQWKGDITINTQSSEAIANWLTGNTTQEPIETIDKTISISPNTVTTGEIEITCQQPLLVNEPGKARRKRKNSNGFSNEEETKDQNLPDQIMYQQSDGKYAIPAQTFIGLMRGTARKILLTQLNLAADQWNKKLIDEADNLIGEIFGSTALASKLQSTNIISNITEAEDLHQQNFIAIDRFTAGVADGAMYTASGLKPQSKLKGQLVIKNDLDDWQNWQKGLLYLVLKELKQGAWLGWGKSKGYGLISLEDGFNSEALLDFTDDSTIQNAINAMNNTIKAMINKCGISEKTDTTYEEKANSKEAEATEKTTEVTAEPTKTLDNDNQFYNPYTFIPAKNIYPDDKGSVATPAELKKTDPAENHRRHDLLLPDRHSGVITCTLTTITDTLVGNQHEEYTDESTIVHAYRHNGKVAFPANSLRGMIGNNMEILSQSSLRILENKTFTVREDFSDAENKKKGQLIKNSQGNWQIEGANRNHIDLEENVLSDLKIVNESVDTSGTKLICSINKIVWYELNSSTSKVNKITPYFGTENSPYRKLWRKRFTPQTTYDAFELAGLENLLPWGTLADRDWLHPAELIMGVIEQQEDNNQNQFNIASRLRFTDATYNQDSNPGRVKNEDSTSNNIENKYVLLKTLASPKQPSEYFYFHTAEGSLIPNGRKQIPNGRKQYLRQHPDNITENKYRTYSQNDDLLKQKSRCNPVSKGQTFTFDIHFQNLNNKEMLLLLKAINPGEGFHHKLGMGKPLGLGTVKVTIDTIRTENKSNNEAEYLKSLDNQSSLIDPETHQCLLDIGQLQPVKNTITYPLTELQLEASRDERDDIKGLSEDELFLWHAYNKSQNNNKKRIISTYQQCSPNPLTTEGYDNIGEKLKRYMLEKNTNASTFISQNTSRNRTDRIKGKVKWFNPTKGFGFIAPESGDDHFLHISSLRNSNTQLKPGQLVEFESTSGKKGPQAKNVVLLTK